MLYVFTGNGKGKTTAAIGTAIRTLALQGKVLMIQFLKTRDTSSEGRVIQKIKNFDIKTFGRKGFFLPKEVLDKNPELRKKGVREFGREDRELASQGMEFAKKAIAAKKYQLIILDEINMALDFGLIDLAEFIGFLKKVPPEINLILTGRNCPQKVMEMADLVTEFKARKHYYQKGIKAVKGIDY